MWHITKTTYKLWRNCNCSVSSQLYASRGTEIMPCMISRCNSQAFLRTTFTKTISRNATFWIVTRNLQFIVSFSKDKWSGRMLSERKGIICLSHFAGSSRSPTQYSFPQQSQMRRERYHVHIPAPVWYFPPQYCSCSNRGCFRESVGSRMWRKRKWKFPCRLLQGFPHIHLQ